MSPSLPSGSLGVGPLGLSPPTPRCRLTMGPAPVPRQLPPLPQGTTSLPTLGPRAVPGPAPREMWPGYLLKLKRLPLVETMGQGP